MKNKKPSKLLRNSNGQGVMEYIILASLIGIFCLGAVKKFGEVVNTRVKFMKSEIVEKIPVR